MQTGIKKIMTKTRAAVQRGFSLLELLVALAVLMLIVLIVSIVFQQTSTIWQGTSSQTGLDMVVRGIVARIQADMAQAVPASNFITYDNTSKTIINKRVTHSFSTTGASEVYFIMLREAPDKTREACAVRYTFAKPNVTRDEVPLEFERDIGWKDINWSHPDKNSQNMGGEVQNARITSIAFKSIFPSPPSLSDNLPYLPTEHEKYVLPVYMDIDVKVEYDNETYSAFAARSRGPDKILFTKDDIYVGGKE